MATSFYALVTNPVARLARRGKVFIDSPMPLPPEPPPDPGDARIKGLARGGCLWLALLTTLLLSGILLWFADLRENQMFWRNAGGYPVELRDLVETSFYPLALATCTGIFLLGWALLFRSRSSPAVWLAQVLVLVISVMIVLGAAVVAFTNNVSNLWNHRPLHAHPEQGVDE